MIARHLIGRAMRPIILAAALALPAACARNRTDQDIQTDGPATVVFSNESLTQADLFAVMPGVDARKLGTVMAGRTEELKVPADIVRRSGSLNFVARLLARSGTPGSGPVPIRPGDRLQIRLPIDGRSLFVVPASS